jgi:hypothetical protein
MKYVAKMEPSGSANMDADAAKALGLCGLNKVEMQVANEAILSKPVSATEACCILSGIDIVQLSIPVTYVDIRRPAQRTRLVKGHGSCKLPAVTVYCNRPQDLHHLTLTEYFQQYVALPPKKEGPAKSQPHPTCDAAYNTVWKLHKPAVLRFTDHHPTHAPESFLYSLLARKASVFLLCTAAHILCCSHSCMLYCFKVACAI